VSEVDRVEIVQQDLRLGHALFELIGKELFLDLSLDTILGGLIRPVCKNVVFDQLLGNSTGAFRVIKAAFKAYIYGAEDTGDIDTAVLVETLVLDRDKGVGKVLGDPGLVNGDTVGIGRDQFGDLIALAVNRAAAVNVCIPAHAFDYLQLRQKTYAATDLLSGSTTSLTLKADAAVGVVVPARNAAIYKLK
jgi:hypothetical protein